MDKSESIKELATALAKAQADFSGAVKDSANPFFKSKYADLESCVSAIKPSLAQHGLSFVQIAHDSENSASIETVILHASGEWLSAGVVSVPVTKNDAQGFGSAMTYARRYSLSAAFGIAPEDDDDGNAASKAKPNGKPTNNPDYQPNEEELAFLNDTILNINGCTTPSQTLQYLKDLDADEYAWVFDKLDSKIRGGIKKYQASLKQSS